MTIKMVIIAETIVIFLLMMMIMIDDASNGNDPHGAQERWICGKFKVTKKNVHFVLVFAVAGLSAYCKRTGFPQVRTPWNIIPYTTPFWISSIKCSMFQFPFNQPSGFHGWTQEENPRMRHAGSYVSFTFTPVWQNSFIGVAGNWAVG